MSQFISLKTALRLPVPDIEALRQGRMIVAMAKTFIHLGQQFALYPSDTSINLLPTERHYRSDFLPTAWTALNQRIRRQFQSKPGQDANCVKSWMVLTS
jgi:hypothetical protein